MIKKEVYFSCVHCLMKFHKLNIRMQPLPQKHTKGDTEENRSSLSKKGMGINTHRPATSSYGPAFSFRLEKEACLKVQRIWGRGTI